VTGLQVLKLGKRFKRLAHYTSGATKDKNSVKRSLKVTITKVRRRQVVSASLDTLYMHCPMCGREVATLSKAQALKVSGLELEVLDEMAAAGEVHLFQIDSSDDRICRDSLFGMAL